MPRPKGSKNTKQLQWERMSQYITRQGIKRYMTILDGLEDKEFLDHFEKILKYFKPTYAAIQADVDGKVEVTINVVGADE